MLAATRKPEEPSREAPEALAIFVHRLEVNLLAI